jgi:hypothetical protein
MDVEGFGPGEVAPLFASCCMYRSAGSAYPGAALPDGNVVRVWIRVYERDGRTSLDPMLIQAHLPWVD